MSDDSDRVDLAELYPLAWGVEKCARCGAETTTTDAWGTPYCAACWAPSPRGSTEEDTG